MPAIWFRLREETWMGDLFWLTGEQMRRLRPFFPESHGKPRVHDRRVLKRRYRRRSRIATRCDRCPTVFFSAIALAATIIFWL